MRGSPSVLRSHAMGAPARKQATYADLVSLPEGLIGEILDGELVAQPRPAARHQRVASRMGYRLGAFDSDGGGDEPGGWWLLDEPELHLGGHVLVPDLAGWRRERMPVIPDVAAFELVPDWVCEVLSASTSARDRTQKLRIYLEVGARSAWLIDPMAATLEAFRAQEGAWLRVGAWAGDEAARAEPFDAIALGLSELWLR